jgi:hypothetical protein
MTAKKQQEQAQEQVEKPNAVRLDYRGIKLVGHTWRSVKDGYTKPFATADACAKHFNQGGEK